MRDARFEHVPCQSKVYLIGYLICPLFKLYHGYVEAWTGSTVSNFPLV